VILSKHAEPATEMHARRASMTHRSRLQQFELIREMGMT